MKPASVQLTAYERYLALPEHLTGEIVDGELYVLPRPAPRHASAATTLTGELTGPFQRGRGGPGGWVFLAEPELHLGENLLSPDLAAWRRDRMPVLPDTSFIELRPDWVCEILSPSTNTHDRGRKMAIYAASGVEHAWLIDPIAKMLELYRLENGRWSQLHVWIGDSKVRAEPFGEIELDLALLWTA
jgi:Uma2 family endonuclease